MDLVILNHGQVARTTPELKPHSRHVHTILMDFVSLSRFKVHQLLNDIRYRKVVGEMEKGLKHCNSSFRVFHYDFNPEHRQNCFESFKAAVLCNL
ncbi:hypothetical protein TNCV_4459621 [Trichonephila clavipes]|nr:hypothetical protein TNCV_4459621 [Trichonephila clavipes]